MFGAKFQLRPGVWYLPGGAAEPMLVVISNIIKWLHASSAHTLTCVWNAGVWETQMRGESCSGWFV